MSIDMMVGTAIVPITFGIGSSVRNVKLSSRCMNWQMVWQIYDYFLTKPTFPSDIVESMAPYLHFSMMRKFVLRSTLCEFDISPMEKNSISEASD